MEKKSLVWPVIFLSFFIYTLVLGQQHNEKEILSKGIRYSENSRYDEAIVEFTKVIQKNPNNAEAYYQRAYAYLEKALSEARLGTDFKPAASVRTNYIEINLSKAASDATKAIEINPRYAEAYYIRGLAKKDISDLTKAILIKPNSAHAYYNRAVFLYERNHDSKRVIADLNKAIEIEPDLADAFLLRGEIYESKGDFDLAISDFTKAIEITKATKEIEINPRYTELYSLRGKAYFEKQEYDKSWKDIHEAEKLGGYSYLMYIDKLKKASAGKRVGN